MWKFGLVCLFVAGASAVPAYSSSSAGASAGSSTGSGSYSSKYGSTYGSNYPYVGGYSSNYVGGGYGAPVIYPVVPPYAGFGFNNDLQHFINSYFNALQSNFASGSVVIASPGTSAKAEAKLLKKKKKQPKSFTWKPNLYAQQFAQQQALFNNLQQASAGGYSNSYAPSYSAASATGAVGPGGVYQTASIYPQSVHSPNVVASRFGSGGGGFQGVSTFASSDSSGNRQAYTSVNDNGRVTTYHTRS